MMINIVILLLNLLNLLKNGAKLKTTYCNWLPKKIMAFC